MDVPSTWRKLEDAVRDWISHPSQRPYTGRVDAEPGGKTIAAGHIFVPEASYFGVRLVEMSLAEGGAYFTRFLPLGVCLTEYTVGEDRQRTPMILSNDVIASQIKATGTEPGYVEYANMYAVRCAPVKADNLSLFVGLFRMPYGDLAKQVLQIAADLTEQVAGQAGGAAAPVAAGLRVAEKVYDRVSSLFGLSDVTPRFGFADGNALAESGYFLVAGPAANTIEPARLRVVENRLHLDGKRAKGFDYCLVAIEYTATRLPQGSDTINPLTSLAFHRRWREIAQLLAAKNTAEAEARIAQLRAEVVVSAELTEDDRLIAIAAYDTSYEKLRRTLAPAVAGSAMRSARSGETAGSLRIEASRREKAGQQATSRVLSQMATRLQVVDGSASDEPDAVFEREAVALRKSLAVVPRGDHNLAASVAEAISGAVTRQDLTT